MPANHWRSAGNKLPPPYRMDTTTRQAGYLAEQLTASAASIGRSSSSSLRKVHSFIDRANHLSSKPLTYPFTIPLHLPLSPFSNPLGRSPPCRMHCDCTALNIGHIGRTIKRLAAWTPRNTNNNNNSLMNNTQLKWSKLIKLASPKSILQSWLGLTLNSQHKTAPVVCV